MKFLIKPNARGGYRGSLLLTLYLISRVVDEKIKHPDCPVPTLLFQFAAKSLQRMPSGMRKINGARQIFFFFFTTLETVSRKAGVCVNCSRGLVLTCLEAEAHPSDRQHDRENGDDAGRQNVRVEVEWSGLALVRMILVQTVVSVGRQGAEQVLSLGGTGVVVSRHA